MLNVDLADPYTYIMKYINTTLNIYNDKEYINALNYVSHTNINIMYPARS